MDISIFSPDGTTRLGVIVADLSTAQVLNPGMLCVPRGTGADLTAIDPVQSGSQTTRRIPASDFRDRFTPAELAGVSMLAYSGDGDVVAQLLLLKVATNRDGIDLDSPETIGGVDYLISKGKLAATRKVEILG